MEKPVLIILITITCLFSVSLFSINISETEKKIYSSFISKKRNINKIKLDYLKRFFPYMGLTISDAENIYNYKKKNGYFTNFEDIKKVHGFTENKINILKNYFIIIVPETYQNKDELLNEVKATENTNKEIIKGVEYLTSIDDEENTENEEQIESLLEFEKNPIDLNSASRMELIELPWISAYIALKIELYRYEHDGFKSVEELKNIPEISIDDYYEIKKYVKIGKRKVKLPFVKKKAKKFSGKIINRTDASFPKRDGYITDNTNDFPKNGKYNFLYQRIDLDLFGHFRIELLGERDYGEEGYYPGEWFPEKWGISKLRLYDMMAFNLCIYNYGALKNIIAGDYKLYLGQGLVSEGYVSSIIMDTGIYKSPVKKNNKGIKAHHSANESLTFRGTAAHLEFGPVNILPFFSCKYFDAKISDDSSVREITIETKLSKIINPGDDPHKTKSEIENRDNIREMIFGGRFELSFEKFAIATTTYKAFYSKLIDPEYLGNNSFYAFRGKDNLVSSIDYDFLIGKLNLFGEYCITTHKVKTRYKYSPAFKHGRLKNMADKYDTGFGFVQGAIFDFSSKLRISTVITYLTPNYYSPHGLAFISDENNAIVSFIGFKWKPNSKTMLWCYNWLYKNLYRSYNLSVNNYKNESLIELQKKIWDKFTIIIREKLQNTRDQYDPYKKYRLVSRLHIKWEPIKVIRIQFRYENTMIFRPDDNWKNRNEFETGNIIYFDIKYSSFKIFSFINRLMYFKTDGSDSTVYVYENNLYLWTRTIPSYSGNGLRYYLIMSNKLFDKFRFEIKYSITYYFSGKDDYYKKYAHNIQTQLIFDW